MTKASKKTVAPEAKGNATDRALAARVVEQARARAENEPEPPCSRCDGEGIDPEFADCVCDCCGGTGYEQ